MSEIIENKTLTQKDEAVLETALKFFIESMTVPLTDNFIGFKSPLDADKRFCTVNEYNSMNNLGKFRVCITSAKDMVDFLSRR